MDILNKTLVTGGSGSVASYVDFGMKANREVFDITSMAQVIEFVEKFKPKVILHLAAETDLTKCENDPPHAYFVNAVGTYNLAGAARKVGAKMVYVSTDSVFPNSKSPHLISEEPKPGSIYGHSKYLGELAVKGLSNDYIIARTSWVFGGGIDRDKKFVAKFISGLEKPEVKAVDDEFGSPTYARDLAMALKSLIIEDKQGIFHLANSGVTSRYEMATVITKVLQKQVNVLPVSSREFGLLAHQHSSGGLVGDLGLRSWREALKEYLETEWV